MVVRHFANKLSHVHIQSSITHPACLVCRSSQPLHDIAITNIVWCMAYKKDVGRRAYIAQWSCNSIAIGQALQVRGGNKRMIDSHNKAVKRNNILYRLILQVHIQSSTYLHRLSRVQVKLAFTRYCYAQYCMVYSMHKGGRRGVEYCAIVSQQYCNHVGNAGGGVVKG